MKNVRYLNVYIVLIIYSFISIFLENINSRMFNLVFNPLLLVFIAIYLFIKTNNNHGRFVMNKKYLKKMLIFSLIYIILYIYLGFIFGFVTSPYSHNFLTLMKNIWQIIVPIIAIEYIRSALLNNNSKNRLYIVTSILIFLLLELNVNSLIRNITYKEAAFKYISSVVLPLIFSEILYTYLSLKGSYKLVLTYRLIVEMMLLLSPIYPDLDWFLTGIVEIIVPTIIYIYCKYDYDKKRRNISRIKSSKQHPISYVPIIIVLIIFASFMAGLFKYKPIVIASNSMDPIFNRGDVVILSKVNETILKNLKKDTIIVYSLDNQFIVHRVVDIVEENGKIYFQTKGDANVSPDLELVSMEQVVGIYEFSIKYIGYPSIWLNETFKNESAKVEIK